MTRVEILKVRLDQLEDQENLLELRTNKLYNRQKKEQKRILETYFGDQFDNFITNISEEQVSISVDGSNYDFVNLYIHSNWRDGSDRYDKIEMSISSFRPERVEEWVVERFEMLTKLSQLIVDFEDDIVAAFNKLDEKYSRLRDTFWQPKKDLRKAIRSQQEDIDKLEKESLMEKLFDEDGISITPEKDDNWLPHFEVKWNWDIQSVKSLRGLKKSASGKSVDLEVKRRFRDWESNDWKFDSVKVERVRFDKVESFLRRNQKYIG